MNGEVVTSLSVLADTLCIRARNPMIFNDLQPRTLALDNRLHYSKLGADGANSLLLYKGRDSARGT